MRATLAVTIPLFLLTSSVETVSGATAALQFKTPLQEEESLEPLPTEQLIALAQEAQSDAQKTPAERFEKGKEIIQQLETSYVIVNFAHQLLIVEQGFNASTSIWSDAEYRKGWDNTQRWLTIAGYAAAATGLVAKTSDDERRALAGGGLGVVFGINLLGKFLGPESGGRIRSRIEYVSYTRGAFDEIKTRSDLSGGLLAKNTRVLEALRNFRDNVYLKVDGGASSTAEEKKALAEKQKAALAGLITYVAGQDDLLGQIPQVINMQKSMLARYQGKQVQGSVAEALVELKRRVDALESTYKTDVERVLKLSPSLMGILTD